MLPSANHIRVGFQEMSEEISIVGMNYMLVHHMVNYREPEKPVSKDLNWCFNVGYQLSCR